jgi:sugar (pentulose or hexulose) kinase
MNIDRNGPKFVEFANASGLNVYGPDMEVSEALFAALNMALGRGGEEEKKAVKQLEADIANEKYAQELREAEMLAKIEALEARIAELEAQPEKRGPGRPAKGK